MVNAFTDVRMGIADGSNVSGKIQLKKEECSVRFAFTEEKKKKHTIVEERRKKRNRQRGREIASRQLTFAVPNMLNMKFGWRHGA